MASLDSPVISPERDVHITFGCIGGYAVLHIVSYTDKLNRGEAEYAFTLQSVGADAPDDTFYQTERGGLAESAAGDYRIAISDSNHKSRILGRLHTAASEEQEKFVGLDVRQGNKVLSANFAPAGIEDALQYLGCFG